MLLNPKFTWYTFMVDWEYTGTSIMWHVFKHYKLYSLPTIKRPSTVNMQVKISSWWHLQAMFNHMNVSFTKVVAKEIYKPVSNACTIVIQACIIFDNKQLVKPLYNKKELLIFLSAVLIIIPCLMPPWSLATPKHKSLQPCFMSDNNNTDDAGQLIHTLTQYFIFFTTYNTDGIDERIIQMKMWFVLLFGIKSRKKQNIFFSFHSKLVT